MYKFFTVLTFCFCFQNSWTQAKLNMELESHISYGSIAGSGCWGHTDKNGIEYAIIGVFDGIRIYSLEDPKNPIERFFIPGENNSWREIRTWDDYIYVTTEGTDGLTIIDASQAPNAFTFKRWFPDLPNLGVMGSHHSINLDSLGYLYLNGSDLAGGAVLLFDLNNDPYNPEFKTVIGNVYTHDCFANANYLYTADLGQGVAIYDIKDKNNPVFLSRFNTSSVFAHNAWTSDDGIYLYTTDERSGAYVDVYDVSDPKNVKFINKYRNKDSQLGKVIPHNTYQVKNWAVTSWYTDGILIKDMTRPDNIVKVGEYDTFYDEAAIQNAGAWFYGCWGVYPFLKSGTIIGSDINAGLWVLKPEYRRASYLEGRVMLQKSERETIGVPNAVVKIINDRVSEDESDQNGIYKTGLFGTGNYKAYVIHPDFTFDTAYVFLSEANVTEHDFIIQAPTLKGNVVNSKGEAIPFSSVSVLKNGILSDFTTITNDQGFFDIIVPKYEESELLIAAWGYKTQSIKLSNLNNLNIVLEEGYQDDFFTDLGWKNTQKASTGNWERVVPKETILDNNFANCNEDVNDDFGNFAYVTGNGGTNVADNDVDNGKTSLESPIMDFSKSDTAVIDFAYWFVNGGGLASTPNDYFKVYLTNGVSNLELLQTTSSNSQWIYSSKIVTDVDLTFTSNMKIICETEDKDPGHIVEAGFDKFLVTLNSRSVSSIKNTALDRFKVYPSVASNSIIISTTKNELFIEVLDVFGRIIQTKNVKKGENNFDISNLNTGMYYIKEQGTNSQMERIIKI